MHPRLLFYGFVFREKGLIPAFFKSLSADRGRPLSEESYCAKLE